MKKQNNLGFSAVEGLLILIVVSVIAFIGWFVLRSQHKVAKTQVSSTSQASQDKQAKETDPITVTAGATPGTLAYTNNTVGFTFNFPEKTEGPDVCVDGNSVFDTYGNPVSAPVHKQTSNGLIKLTVLNNGDYFYVTPEKSYVTSDYINTTVGGHQYPLAHACEEVATTPQLIEKYDAQQGVVPSYATIPYLKFTLKKVKKEAIESEVQNIFNDTSLKVTKLSDSTQGNWQDLSFSCSKDPCAYTGGRYVIRYYAKQDVLFFWNAGQACNLSANDSATNVDCQDGSILDSLKLLN